MVLGAEAGGWEVKGRQEYVQVVSERQEYKGSSLGVPQRGAPTPSDLGRPHSSSSAGERQRLSIVKGRV